MDLKECKDLLKQYGQEHLLHYYEELDEDQQNQLLRQIEKIDFELMKSLYQNKDTFEIEDKEISNVEAIEKDRINQEKYEMLGIELLKKGKLAVCSLAGGQGTRLGFHGPKGTYMLPLEKPTSIFEIEVNKLKQTNETTGNTIFWYIMTSKQNHDDTVQFFEQNHYFQYPKDHIMFFEQGELPLLDTNGKIVLKDKANVFTAPDGNGGIFKALGEEGILEHMRKHGIDYLAIGNVDNILIHMADPILIALMDEKKAELAPKSFMKPSPSGKWGVFCKINGEFSVIEYIETPKDLLEARDEEGNLIFGDAHFGCNFFQIDLLERIVSEKLKMHAACKKNEAFIVESNKNVEIDTYKFESFIFDTFGKAKKTILFRVKKDDEFAPIKNKEGEESPQTAIELYKKFYHLT